MLETMMRVMDELARRACPASLEYPGFILIDRPEGRGVLAFGDANETWACDVWADCRMENHVETIESTISRESTDPVAIANFIVFVAVTAGVFAGTGDVPFVDLNFGGRKPHGA